MTSEKTGRLWMEKNQICFKSQEYGNWSFPVEELRIIGEYTNEDGPFAEDHYLLFLTSSGHYFETPVSADGFSTVISGLSSILNYELRLGLDFVTKIQSAVLYPPSLCDATLFTTSNKTRNGSSVLTRLLDSIRGRRIQLTLGEEVREYIEKARSR